MTFILDILNGYFRSLYTQITSSTQNDFNFIIYLNKLNIIRCSFV